MHYPEKLTMEVKRTTNSASHRLLIIYRNTYTSFRVKHYPKNTNIRRIAILTCFRASYAEKGYYLWTIRLLLIGDIITTYGQKGYYLWVSKNNEFTFLIYS